MAVQESSSSSSSGSTHESETDSEPEPQAAASKLELTVSPLIEIYPSVKTILDKIDAAQLDRARKEVSKQLFVILNNVNRACDRFQENEGMDPEIEKQFLLTNTWAERKRRALLRDKVAILLKASTTQGKDLKFVLESLKEWDEMLSEGKEQVGNISTAQWVSDMETKLLTSLDYTEGCIMKLIDLCTPLVEQKRKKRRKSIIPKTGMWRAWREKVVQKPQEAQPLSPEQMLEDESETFARTSELLTMLQEFVACTLFNKAEAVAVKYIVTMVVNLTKAFSLLNKQCHSLQAKYDNLAFQESRKQETQYVNLQKEVQLLNETKASLEDHVQSIEHKYKMLLAANEAMQKELHKVKEKATLKMERSLGDMKLGAKASSERKSQEECDKDLSRKKDGKLSAEKLSWKSHADPGKSLSGKREAKVADKKQPQKPLVERTEDTSNTHNAKLLDKKPPMKVSAERGKDTSDKQKALAERTQDTVVEWGAVATVEKQGTSGDLSGELHGHPLDSEQAAAAGKRDVNLLGKTQEIGEYVTGECQEILPDEHGLQADSEKETERLSSPTEPPSQGVSRKGKQKKESLHTEATQTEIPRSPVSGSKLDPSTPLYGFNSAVLAYLEQKIEKLLSCPPPAQRQAERMLPKDPEAQRLYVALERKLEECFSKMEMKYSSILEEQTLPRSLVLTEEHDEEAKPSSEGLPGIFAPGKEVPIPSIQLSGPNGSFLESKIPVISQWGLPLALWKEPNISMRFPFPNQKQQEQWQKEEQEFQMQWQSPQPQQQQPGIKGKVEQLHQEEHQWEAQEPLKEGQEEKKKWKKQLEEQAGEQRLRQQQLEQQQQQLEDEQQRLRQQCQEEKQQQEEHEEQQRLWQQQQEEHEEQQRLWQQQQEERQSLWQQQEVEHEEQQKLWQQQEAEQQQQREQHEEQLKLWQQQEEEREEQQRLWQQQQEEQHEEQLKLWHQEEQEHMEQARRWQQQVEEHDDLWQQEQEEHDLQLKKWLQQEVKQRKQAIAWQQQMQEQEEQRQLWQQEQEEHDFQLRQWQEQERLWQQHWQEQLQQLHEQELQQKQMQQEQEQYLTPRSKSVPKSREPGAPEHLTKQIPLRPRRETAKEEVLLYGCFQPSAQQMVPTQSKISLHSQAQFTEETSWFPTLAQKTKEKSSMSEKRYWVDVEAQRENLVLLGQATQKCRLPPHLHMQAKAVITETLHTDVERLALLFHKYISFCHLQHVRQTLMSRLEAARTVNDGAEVRNLYTYVERVDAYRKKVLQCWVAKQKAAEQARRHCLGKMISLFAQLRLSSELQLNSPSPLLIKAVDEMKEFQSVVRARSKSPGYPSPLASMKKVEAFMHPPGVSEQVGDQMESVWRTDVISHSFPIVPKPPVSLLWSQAGGFPDIPRFLELDVSSVRSKPLRTLQTQVQNLPRWKTYGHK